MQLWGKNARILVVISGESSSLLTRFGLNRPSCCKSSSLKPIKIEKKYQIAFQINFKLRRSHCHRPLHPAMESCVPQCTGCFKCSISVSSTHTSQERAHARVRRSGYQFARGNEIASGSSERLISTRTCVQWPKEVSALQYFIYEYSRFREVNRYSL